MAAVWQASGEAAVSTHNSVLRLGRALQSRQVRALAGAAGGGRVQNQPREAARRVLDDLRLGDVIGLGVRSRSIPTCDKAFSFGRLIRPPILIRSRVKPGPKSPRKLSPRRGAGLLEAAVSAVGVG